MELDAAAELQRPRPPWRRTVAIQAALCLALYAAFSLGEPQLRPRAGDALGSGGRAGGDVYFLSVAGGARSPSDQARLLRQMESIPKVYGVKFVLDVARFGDDPLWQNGSLYFQALNIPWYSTTSHGQIVDNFLKKVKTPYDQILEIIGVDTGPLQGRVPKDHDATHSFKAVGVQLQEGPQVEKKLQRRPSGLHTGP